MKVNWLVSLKKMAVEFFNKYQSLRFLMMGGINTLFSFCVYAALIGLGFSVLVSLVVCTVAGICFNFITLGGVVFKDLSAKRMPRFFAAYGIILFVNYKLIYLLSELTGNKILSQAIIAIPLAILSYVMLSQLVFKKPCVKP